MHVRGFEAQIAKNRRLLRMFVGRDLRARYAGSMLGIYWHIIHPLILLLLYIVVFSTLARGRFSVGGRMVDYAILIIPAIVAWNWLNESLMGASTAITSNASLIKKVVFPSAILPLGPLLTGLIPFAVAMLIYFVFAAIVGVFNWYALIYLPLVAALQFLVMIGPAYLLASLNVFVRDTAQVLVAGMQLLFWSTPIVYPPDALTKHLPWVEVWFEINPVAQLVDAYRRCLILGQAPRTVTIVYLCAIAVLGYYVGRMLFIRGRRHFPDEV